MKIKFFIDLNPNELNLLNDFINEKSKNISYDLSYLNFIDSYFNYKNYSKVYFSDKFDEVLGFLPQWIVQNNLISIPTRDLGGPLFKSKDILQNIKHDCFKDIKLKKLKNFIWKDFKHEGFEYTHELNQFILNIKEKNFNDYLKKQSKNLRKIINRCQSNNLRFKFKENNKENIIHFYNLFSITRRNLGSPVFDKQFFFELFKHTKNLFIFNVEIKDKVLASLICYTKENVLIKLYSGHNHKYRKLLINDFMFVNLLKHCLDNKIEFLIFGSDSILQKNLKFFKTKWGAIEKKNFFTSNKKIQYLDHNKPKYLLIRLILKYSPLNIYHKLSKLIFKYVQIQ